MMAHPHKDVLLMAEEEGYSRSVWGVFPECDRAMARPRGVSWV